MGMGIKYGIRDENGREWETTSMGTGITCTPMGIYSHRFFMKLLVLPIAVATRQMPMPCVPSLPTTEITIL